MTRSLSTPVHKLPSRLDPRALKGSPRLQRSLSGVRSSPKMAVNLSSAKNVTKPSGAKLQTPKVKAKPLVKTPTPKRPLQLAEMPKPVPRVPKIIDRGPIDCCDSLVVETDMGFPCNFCEVTLLFCSSSTQTCSTLYHRYLRISLIEERWLDTCRKSTLRSSLLNKETPISLDFSRVPPVALFFTASSSSAHIEKRTRRLSWVLVTSTSGIICLLGRSRFETVITDLLIIWLYGLRMQNGTGLFSELSSSQIKTQ